MIPMTAVLLLVTLMAAAVVMLAVGRWMRNESKTDARLHAPGAHTVAYVVPNGQEPALLMSALARAGFAVVAESLGGEEVLLIECEESDRATVRRVIETVLQAQAADHPEARFEQVRFRNDKPIASA